jgi:hypothetical protein
VTTGIDARSFVYGLIVGAWFPVVVWVWAWTYTLTQKRHEAPPPLP